MNNEIIEMAKESNLVGVIDSFHYNQNNWLEEATAFAKLAAAKEREKIASFIEELDERGFKELAGLIRARGEA